MGDVTNIRRARFAIGELVQHRLFNYRGVIFDVDPQFLLTDQWYEAVAASRPPRDKPWYHVLVDGAEHTTYVAEQNLVSDGSGKPIKHPMLGDFFSEFDGVRYVGRGRRSN